MRTFQSPQTFQSRAKYATLQQQSFAPAIIVNVLLSLFAIVRNQNSFKFNVGLFHRRLTIFRQLKVGDLIENPRKKIQGTHLKKMVLSINSQCLFSDT